MSFFDDPENAEKYIKMAEGYDGANLVEIITKHLPVGKSVLELGMGPGVDLDMLAKNYQVTGSDYSAYFVDRYKKLHAGADAVQLDAVEMNIERRFDCIYSNKVLHQFSDDQLKASFTAQSKCLNNDGLILHSFWTGDHMDEKMGMHFYYRQPEPLAALLGERFKLIDSQTYTEMDEGDSFWVLAQKR